MSNVVQFSGTTKGGEAGVSSSSQKRWLAQIEYGEMGGPGSWAEYDFEEISELASIIERGPDWNTLVRCVVTLNRHTDHPKE